MVRGLFLASRPVKHSCCRCLPACAVYPGSHKAFLSATVVFFLLPSYLTAQLAVFAQANTHARHAGLLKSGKHAFALKLKTGNAIKLLQRPDYPQFSASRSTSWPTAMPLRLRHQHPIDSESNRRQAGRSSTTMIAFRHEQARQHL